MEPTNGKQLDKSTDQKIFSRWLFIVFVPPWSNLSKYEQQSSLVVTLLWIFYNRYGCNIWPNMAECNPRFYAVCHGGNRNAAANKFLKTNF